MVQKIAIAACCFAIALHVLYLPGSSIIYVLQHPAPTGHDGGLLLGQAAFGVLTAVPFIGALLYLRQTANARVTICAVAAALASDAYFEAIVRRAVAAGDGQSAFGYIMALGLNLLIVIAVCTIGGWLASLNHLRKRDA